MSQAFSSSALGARPTPYFWVWAERPHANRTTVRALDIAHTSVRGDLPFLDDVVVISRIHAAHRHQFIEGRLHITRLVRGARLQHGLTALPFPRQAEACEG